MLVVGEYGETYKRLEESKWSLKLDAESRQASGTALSGLQEFNEVRWRDARPGEVRDLILLNIMLQI